MLASYKINSFQFIPRELATRLLIYIHQNPVKAKLVRNTADREYSSAIDYANLRNGKLVNKEVAKEYIQTRV